MAAVKVYERIIQLFEAEGIKIDRRTYANGPAAMLDFPNQSIDAVMAAIVPFMQFAARGGEFKLIMSLTKYNAPLVGPKKYTSYKELDGKKVFIKGYMYPSSQMTGIREFVLCRDNGTCCFGGQPRLTDMIRVKLKDRSQR